MNWPSTDHELTIDQLSTNHQLTSNYCLNWRRQDYEPVVPCYHLFDFFLSNSRNISEYSVMEPWPEPSVLERSVETVAMTLRHVSARVRMHVAAHSGFTISHQSTWVVTGPTVHTQRQMCRLHNLGGRCLPRTFRTLLQMCQKIIYKVINSFASYIYLYLIVSKNIFYKSYNNHDLSIFFVPIIFVRLSGICQVFWILSNIQSRERVHKWIQRKQALDA